MFWYKSFVGGNSRHHRIGPEYWQLLFRVADTKTRVPRLLIYITSICDNNVNACNKFSHNEKTMRRASTALETRPIVPTTNRRHIHNNDITIIVNENSLRHQNKDTQKPRPSHLFRTDCWVCSSSNLRLVSSSLSLSPSFSILKARDSRRAVFLSAVALIWGRKTVEPEKILKENVSRRTQTKR